MKIWCLQRESVFVDEVRVRQETHGGGVASRSQSSLQDRGYPKRDYWSDSLAVWCKYKHCLQEKNDSYVENYFFVDFYSYYNLDFTI